MALAMLEECDTLHWREYEDLRDKYHALQRAYNELAAEHNRVVAATRPRQHIGRPLAASHSQKADVLKRREAGQSLRSIADDTGLSLRTVCTITEKADGVDRATRKRLERIDPARIRLSAAEHRSRKKILPNSRPLQCRDQAGQGLAQGSEGALRIGSRQKPPSFK